MYNDYDEIRKQAEERVKKRESAKEGLIAFFLIDGFMWVVWIIALLAGARENVITATFWALLAISFIWGFIAIGTWYDDVYALEQREEQFRQEVEKEIERELEKRALTEKRKRIALSDDGELVELLDEENPPVENSYTQVNER